MLLCSSGGKTSKEIALIRKCRIAFDYDLNENDLEQQHTTPILLFLPPIPPKKTHNAYL